MGCFSTKPLQTLRNSSDADDGIGGIIGNLDLMENDAKNIFENAAPIEDVGSDSQLSGQCAAKKPEINEKAEERGKETAKGQSSKEVSEKATKNDPSIEV